jgi:hydrogenase/urease accessory protein HupE
MRRATVAALVLAATAGSATAHAPAFGATGFAGGLLHPISVPAHVLVLAGLGLLAGQQAVGRMALLAMFALGVVSGLAAIVFAAGPSSAPLVLSAVAIVTGLWTASARPLPAVAGWPLMSVAGAALGLDSPPEVVDLATANRMLIGTAIGAVVALAVIVGIVAVLRRDWLRLGIRIAGSWVAAAAMLVLALALVR